MMSIGRHWESLLCISLWMFLLTCDGVLITSTGARAASSSAVHNNTSSMQTSASLPAGPPAVNSHEGAPATVSLAYKMPSPGDFTNLEEPLLSASPSTKNEQSAIAMDLGPYNTFVQKLKDSAALAPLPQGWLDLPKTEGSPLNLNYLTASSGIAYGQEPPQIGTGFNSMLVTERNTPGDVQKPQLSPSTTRPTLVELLEQLEQRLSQEGIIPSKPHSQQQLHATPGIPRNSRKRPEPSDSAAIPVLVSSSLLPLPSTTASTTNLVFVISPEMATRTIKNLMGSLSEEITPTNRGAAVLAKQPVVTPVLTTPAPKVPVEVPKLNTMTFQLNPFPQQQQRPSQQPLLPASILPPTVPISNEYLKETVLPYLASLATAQAAQAAFYPAAAAAAMRAANIGDGIGTGSANPDAPYVDPVAVQLMASAQQHMNKHGWHNPSQHAMVNQFMSTITPTTSVEFAYSSQPGATFTNFGTGLGIPNASGVRVGGIADIGTFLSNLGISQPNSAVLSGGGIHAPGSISALAASAQASTEQASR